MQKEVKVVDYLSEVAMSLTETYRNSSIPTSTLEAHARIFFNTFGIQTVESLVAAYDEKPESSEEAYKCLFILFKEIKNANAEYFIEFLRRGLKAMQEQEKSAWDE